MKKFILIAITSLSVLMMAGCSDKNTAVNNTINPAIKKQVDQYLTSNKALNNTIHQYLVTHPGVLDEMIKARQQKYIKEQNKTASSIAQLYQKDTQTVVEGNPQGAKTLIEFYDSQCSMCKAAWPQIEAAIAKNSDLKVVFVELPFIKGSTFAANVSLATYALDKSKYSDFHKNIMTLSYGEGQLTQDEVMTVAQNAGYNKQDILNYIKNNQKQITNELTTNQKRFRQLGFQGTPSFILTNNQGETKTIQGVPQNLQKQIESIS